MGITADEAHRAKTSPHPWKIHAFPFIDIPMGLDYLDKRWKRQDCINWLEEHYPDRVVPRSACIGCPYHSDKEWRRIKENPEEWADAVEYDKLTRTGGRGLKGTRFLHAKRIPLDQVDLRTDNEKGQPDLWGNECDGMCGM